MSALQQTRNREFGEHSARHRCLVPDAPPRSFVPHPFCHPERRSPLRPSRKPALSEAEGDLRVHLAKGWETTNPDCLVPDAPQEAPCPVPSVILERRSPRRPSRKPALSEAEGDLRVPLAKGWETTNPDCFERAQPCTGEPSGSGAAPLQFHKLPGLYRLRKNLAL